jgi:hypothetical protein
LGTLYAYTALPNANDILKQDFSSADTWFASTFARPTVMYASAFVPTYAVSASGRPFPGTLPTCNSTQSAPYASGILR